MNTELYLSPAEIEDLTGKRTKPAQERRLRELKIPFLDGRPPRVLRSVALARGGEQKPARGEQRPEGYAAEPDFSIF